MNSLYKMTYEVCKEAYKDENIEFSDERLIISIRNCEYLGMCKNSDIIIRYDEETHCPIVVAERVYASNYTHDEYKKLLKQWKLKAKYTHMENSFRLEISIRKKYADYIFYKKEWLRRELLNALQL